MNDPTAIEVSTFPSQPTKDEISQVLSRWLERQPRPPLRVVIVFPAGERAFNLVASEKGLHYA